MAQIRHTGRRHGNSSRLNPYRPKRLGRLLKRRPSGWSYRQACPYLHWNTSLAHPILIDQGISSITRLGGKIQSRFQALGADLEFRSTLYHTALHVPGVFGNDLLEGIVTVDIGGLDDNIEADTANGHDSSLPSGKADAAKVQLLAGLRRLPRLCNPLIFFNDYGGLRRALNGFYSSWAQIANPRQSGLEGTKNPKGPPYTYLPRTSLLHPIRNRRS